jgi:hypothetical protein
VVLRARWVVLKARWVVLRNRWVVLRARWVTLRALWVRSLNDAKTRLGDSQTAEDGAAWTDAAITVKVHTGEERGTGERSASSLTAEMTRVVTGGRAMETLSLSELAAAQLAVSELAARLARATHHVLLPP